jgi:hypothetical protein
MTEKGEAEWSIAAYVVQTVLRDIGNRSDGGGAQVGELIGFDVAPDLFGRIEIRSIARYWLDPQPDALVGSPLHHPSAAMRGQPVPQQDHRTVPLNLMHICQKLDQHFVVVGARPQLENEVSVTGIGFVHQRGSHGQPLPGEVMP